MKASGLGNLNFYSKINIIGDMGRVSVIIIIIGAIYGICFENLNCQIIFVLFIVGSVVNDVTYVIRV